MTYRSDGDASETLSPDDAFTLVGNETRIDILQTLWASYEPYGADNTVSFSELFDRVGAEDTGNFNYHLGKLIGHFVRRTDGGYELSAPGFKIVRAIVGGGVTGNPTLESSRVGERCKRCDGPIEITYDDGTTWARCTACDGYWSRQQGGIFGFSLPPEGLRDRSPAEVLDATVVYSIHRFETMIRGVCPECGARVDASLAVCEEHDAGDGVCAACDSFFMGVITAICTSCKFPWRSPSYAPVSHHPALISFYYDHGIEHVPGSWAGINRGLGWLEERVSTSPGALRLIVQHDGSERRFTLDRTGTVVTVE